MNRLYLVDTIAALKARERQARENKKRQARRDAIHKQKKAALFKKPAPAVKPETKPRPRKKSNPAIKRQYRHAVIPYKLGMGKEFYDTIQWQKLRYKAIKLYGKTCHCCGASEVEIHVDHIKPRSKYPQLELEINNLQILCRACNLGKSNTDAIDWRTTGTLTQSANRINSATNPPKADAAQGQATRHATD